MERGKRYRVIWFRSDGLMGERVGTYLGANVPCWDDFDRFAFDKSGGLVTSIRHDCIEQFNEVPEAE